MFFVGGGCAGEGAGAPAGLSRAEKVWFFGKVYSSRLVEDGKVEKVSTRPLVGDKKGEKLGKVSSRNQVSDKKRKNNGKVSRKAK